MQGQMAARDQASFIWGARFLEETATPLQQDSRGLAQGQHCNTAYAQMKLTGGLLPKSLRLDYLLPFVMQM